MANRLDHPAIVRRVGTQGIDAGQQLARFKHGAGAHAQGAEISLAGTTDPFGPGVRQPFLVNRRQSNLHGYPFI